MTDKQAIALELTKAIIIAKPEILRGAGSPEEAAAQQYERMAIVMAAHRQAAAKVLRRGKPTKPKS